MLLDKHSGLAVSDKKDMLSELLAGAITVFDISGTFFLKSKEPRVGYTAVLPLSSEAIFEDLEQDVKILDLDMTVVYSQGE